MKVSAHASFNGNCRQAFEFYHKVLGGIISMTYTYAEGGECMWTEETKDLIMHTRLDLGDTVIMGSDCAPQFRGPRQGYDLTISTDTPEEAERIYNALSEGGEVLMPLGEMVFAKHFAMFTDQFGTPWMIICQ